MATAQMFSDDYSEKCLLSMMINNGSIVDMINGRIEKEYFYNPNNVKIYEKICYLQKNRKPINLVTVANAETPKLAKICAEITSLTSAFFVSSMQFVRQ